MDPNRLFQNVITWKDTFEAHALKHIKVTYELPMSIVAIDIGDKLATQVLSYFFTYITKTAYTWRQPLKEAIFKVDFSNLLSQLESHFRFKIHSPAFFDFKRLASFKYEPLIYLRYEGDGNFSHNDLIWVYKNKIPKELIDFAIDIVMLPAFRKDIEPFVKELPQEYVKGRINKWEFLANLLNFYEELYVGKMKPALWYNNGILMEPEKKQAWLEQSYHIQFLLEGERDEIAKIIEYLEGLLRQRAKEILSSN